MDSYSSVDVEIIHKDSSREYYYQKTAFDAGESYTVEALKIDPDGGNPILL